MLHRRHEKAYIVKTSTDAFKMLRKQLGYPEPIVDEKEKLENKPALEEQQQQFKMSDLNGKFKCKACYMGFQSKNLFERHRKTKDHKANEQKLNGDKQQ